MAVNESPCALFEERLDKKEDSKTPLTWANSDRSEFQIGLKLVSVCGLSPWSAHMKQAKWNSGRPEFRFGFSGRSEFSGRPEIFMWAETFFISGRNEFSKQQWMALWDGYWQFSANFCAWFVKKGSMANPGVKKRYVGFIHLKMSLHLPLLVIRPHTASLEFSHIWLLHPHPSLFSH